MLPGFTIVSGRRYHPRVVQEQRDSLVLRAQTQAEQFAAKVGARAWVCRHCVQLGRGELKPCYDYVEHKVEDKTAEEPAPEEDEPVCVLFIKAVPAILKRAQLSDFLNTTQLKFSEPVASKQWIRLLWATYDTPEECAAAYEKCNGVALDGHLLELAVL